MEDDPRVNGTLLTRRPAAVKRLEHDPEKWEPVFGKDHAQLKN
jgi:hypothetical protein